MRVSLLLATVLLLILPAPWSFGDEPEPALPIASTLPGLSLADLESMALKSNPTLAQAAAAVEMANGKAKQAGLYPNPTVGYIGDQINIQGTAGELQGGYLQQTIITAHKLKLSRAKYQQSAVEAEWIALAQQYKVLNGVRQRFFQVLASQQLIDLSQQLHANAEEFQKTTREMANTGQANRADVLLAEVDVNKAMLGLRSAENNYRAHWEALLAVVGEPECPPQPLAGSIDPNPHPLDFETSLARLMEESPEIRYAQAHYQFDQITLQREKVQPIPDIQVFGNYGRNYETKNYVGAIAVGVEVPLFNRNQGTIRQAEAELARARAEVERVQLNLRQRLAQVFAQYLTARQKVETYRAQTLPKITEAYEILQDMYNQRRAPWPRVVELQREVLRTRVEYVHLQVELKLAEVAICGLLLVDGLNVPPPPQTSGHLDVSPRPR
jgi:cobalt-zinc-cadmium efflux system outer membrane protein